MRKVLLIILIMCLFISCSVDLNRKICITIDIPNHPWEIAGNKLWYTLKWTDGNTIYTRYLDKTTRNIKLYSANNRTVLIALYPMGTLNPFGGYYSPNNESTHVLLSQQDGVLIASFLRLEPYCRTILNVQAIKNEIDQLGIDYRLIDYSTLLTDLSKQAVKKSSFKILERQTIENLVIPSGLYISENKKEATFYIWKNQKDKLLVTPGWHRYYNFEKDIELKIFCDAETKKITTFLESGLL